MNNDSPYFFNTAIAKYFEDVLYPQARWEGDTLVVPAPSPEVVSEAALEEALLILAEEHDAPPTVKVRFEPRMN